MSNDKPQDDNTKELMGAYSDLISTLVQLERVLEARGVHVESRVVTRRERRRKIPKRPPPNVTNIYHG